MTRSGHADPGGDRGAGPAGLLLSHLPALEGIDGDRPAIGFRAGSRDQELACDVVAGCDGFHGVCRDAVPAGAARTFEGAYPFAWLGVLAAVIA
jgi:p-hydroxybenzoate 3-monooxygenase